MNLRIAIYAAESFLIAAGFIFLALRVIPMATSKSPITRWGGILFFLTGAAAHIDTAITVLSDSHAFYGHHVAAQWRAIGFHGAQMIALYLFLVGLYVEYVRWGPFYRPSEFEEDEIKAEMARRWGGGEDRRVGSDPNFKGPDRRKS